MVSSTDKNVDRMIENMNEKEVKETLEILQNSKNLSYYTIEQVAKEWVQNDTEEQSKGKGWCQ
jgi:hypothetical protein